MPTILDFARIARIKGVKSFILVRKDGQVMTHNVEDPRALSSLILQCGLNSDAVRALMGLSGFRHLSITRENGEHLHLFPAPPYYIGVFQSAEAAMHPLVQDLGAFIENIMKKPSKKKTEKQKEHKRVTFVTPLD